MFKVKNNSKPVSYIDIINTIVKTDILVLPNLYGYILDGKKLYPYITSEQNLDKCYQQAFKLFDEYTLYIDVYDRVLNHYRVWRLGRDILSSTKFEVENIQQF